MTLTDIHKLTQYDTLGYQVANGATWLDNLDSNTDFVLQIRSILTLVYYSSMSNQKHWFHT